MTNNRLPDQFHDGNASNPVLSPRAGERVSEERVRGITSCIAPDQVTGTAMAVVVDDVPLVHTAQVFPLPRRSKIIPADNAGGQATVVLENLDAILKSAGSDLSQVVKLNVYLAQADAMPRIQQALARAFSGETKPAVSFVVGDLSEPGALVAMDAVAVSSIESKEVKRFQSAAVLPAGPKINVSGMADTNSLPIATRKTLGKLIAAIGHVGLQAADIVQLKAFLQPMSEVNAVRKEIVEFFGGNAPPTVFVEWISSAPNPPIEIELIAAARGDFSKEPESVGFLTPPGTASAKVYSRVARVNHGNLVFVSGLYGMKASDGAGQVREIFSALGQVVKQTGSDFEHLVKATYYVTDDDASNKLNDIRPEFYNPQRPPAASKAKVKGVGLAGKTVTMDMIAVVK
jgi:enamine deaminase RidA (YjgF/YER057c/UK114 family)